MLIQVCALKLPSKMNVSDYIPICSLNLHDRWKIIIDSEIISSLGWSADCQLFTCSDDKSIVKWGSDGSSMGKIATVNYYITGISWYPSSGNRYGYIGNNRECIF